MVSPWEIATTVTRAGEDGVRKRDQLHRAKARKRGQKAPKVSRAGILYNHTVKAWEGCACVVDTVGQYYIRCRGAKPRFTGQFADGGNWQRHCPAAERGASGRAVAGYRDGRRGCPPRLASWSARVACRSGTRRGRAKRASRTRCGSRAVRPGRARGRGRRCAAAAAGRAPAARGVRAGGDVPAGRALAWRRRRLRQLSDRIPLRTSAASTAGSCSR